MKFKQFQTSIGQLYNSKSKSVIANIDKISLYTVSLDVRFYHLVHHIGPKHFNIQKSVLYIEKSVVGQVITRSKSEMTR